MAQAPVQTQDLGHLVADGEHRVQGGHGLLKDHGDAVAPDLAQPRLGAIGQVFPQEADLARDSSGLGDRQEAQDGHGGDGLAAARFPHQTQGFPGVEIKAHPGQGPDPAPGGGEMDREVPHRQEGGAFLLQGQIAGHECSRFSLKFRFPALIQGNIKLINYTC